MPNIETSSNFLDTLIKAHSSVKVTMETERNGMLPFLGIQLVNRSPQIEAKVYVKPTNSGLLLRPWQTRTHCCGHIVAHDVSWAAQTGKHLLRTQNVSEQNQKHVCVPDTKFVSATNVARAGKRGNIFILYILRFSRQKSMK